MSVLFSVGLLILVLVYLWRRLERWYEPNKCIVLKGVAGACQDHSRPVLASVIFHKIAVDDEGTTRVHLLEFQVIYILRRLKAEGLVREQPRGPRGLAFYDLTSAGKQVLSLPRAATVRS